MTDFPQFKKSSLYKDVETIVTNGVSMEPKIITGLKLSEAIKYLEENDGVLIKFSGTSNIDTFYRLKDLRFDTDLKYDIKLPPPKTVSVTRADIEKAFYAQNLSILSNAGILDALCKELGL